MSLHTATFSTSFRGSLFLPIPNLSLSPTAFSIARRNSFRSFCLLIHDPLAIQNDRDLSNNRKSLQQFISLSLYCILLFIMSLEVVWEFTIWVLLTRQVTN